MDKLFGNQIKQIHLIFCTKSVEYVYKKFYLLMIGGHRIL